MAWGGMGGGREGEMRKWGGGSNDTPKDWSAIRADTGGLVERLIGIEDDSVALLGTLIARVQAVASCEIDGVSHAVVLLLKHDNDFRTPPTAQIAAW